MLTQFSTRHQGNYEPYSIFIIAYKEAYLMALLFWQGKISFNLFVLL